MEDAHRGIADSAFNLGYVGPINFGRQRQCFLGHSRACPSFAQVFRNVLLDRLERLTHADSMTFGGTDNPRNIIYNELG